tara:strand:- start:1818 stop:2021 length:204 start_codon:yes stop_codon:yes gene_type:complete
MADSGPCRYQRLIQVEGGNEHDQFRASRPLTASVAPRLLCPPQNRKVVISRRQLTEGPAEKAQKDRS